MSFDVFPNLMISDSVGSSETGFGGIGFATKGLEQRGGPKVGANRFTVVVDDDNRVLEPGSGAEGWLAKLGNVPLGYYKDPVKSRSEEHTSDLQSIMRSSYAV